MPKPTRTLSSTCEGSSTLSKPMRGLLWWNPSSFAYGKTRAGGLGFAQTHEDAALDLRRVFDPFETHAGLRGWNPSSFAYGKTRVKGLGLAQTHEDAVLDLRRVFDPFETHAGAS